MNIQYDFSKKRVKQLISSSDIYTLFSGNIEEVEKKFREWIKHYKDNYLKKSVEISTMNTLFDRYLDGNDWKRVKFDNLVFVVSRDKYNDTPIIEIYGERNMDKDELKALENQKKENKDKERKTWERLNKIYGGKGSKNEF